jgi:protein tyrosine phosphatase (PTP) superfamily phosphohydrolase (DUF442 family)
MRLIWLNEVVAANVSDGADASNFAWADMADANESNDGKFDFCRTATSSHLQYHFTQQSANMMRDKSMSFKLDNIIVITIY